MLTDQIDPIKFCKRFWPEISLYDKQEEICYSVWFNDETVVPAGHMLGKDFIASFIALAFFLTRQPCRIITTSVADRHLDVLWGEINARIATCKYPLASTRGGPLLINHRFIRRVNPETGEVDPLSYIRGIVCEREEGLSGHHIAQMGDQIPRTLLIVDEASGVPAWVFERGSEWANRLLVIGNPYECANYFLQAVDGKPGTGDKGGDIPR